MITFLINSLYKRLQDDKCATAVTTVNKEQNKGNKELEPIAIEGKGTNENSEAKSMCSGRKTEGTTQIDEIKEFQDNLNKKLIDFDLKLMTMMHRNFESIERMNDEIINLKRNVEEGQEKIADEVMKSLNLELNS